MSDCIFCQITQGKLPAAVIYEDSDAMVILDLFPVTFGHTLILSKAHAPTLAGLPATTKAHMLTLQDAVIAALQKADPSILAQNLMVNDGPESNQHIPHVHWHIIPRRKGDSLRSLVSFFTRMLNRFGLEKRQRQHQAFAEQVKQHLSL